MVSPPLTSSYAAVGRPLLVTGHPGLLDDLLRLCAAAGVEPDVAPDVAAARLLWTSAAAVVVGADLADALSRARLGRRDDVVLVGSDGGQWSGTEEVGEEAVLWERAVAVGAQDVVFLPTAEPWLVERLADAAEGRAAAGLLVGVLGGRGGAGASTLAAALAVTGSRAGQSSLLVDADPLGGGIDLVLGGEDCAGPRWPELAGTRGRVSAATLRESLPRMAGVPVLSWDRGSGLLVPPEAMDAVLAAGRRGGGVVVVDLPRRLDPTAELALARCDLALLVVPAEVRATTAAARVVAAARIVAADLRVVVRGPAPSGLPAGVVAEMLRLPLAADLPAEPRLAAALERGEPPARRGRGPLAGFCRDFLATAARDHPAAA